MQTTISGKYQVMIPDTSSRRPGLKPRRKLGRGPAYLDLTCERGKKPCIRYRKSELERFLRTVTRKKGRKGPCRQVSPRQKGKGQTGPPSGKLARK